MDIKEYHADTSRISKSGLDLINRSPLHYWDAYLNPERQEREDTEAFIVGRAVHTAILEPNEFDARYFLGAAVDKRTKEGKAMWADMQEFAQGREILKPEIWDSCQRIKDAVWKHPVAATLLNKGQAETTIKWDEDSTGAKCRIRPDWLSATGYVVDVKTTTDASQSAFANSIIRYRYHVQDAFYSDGVEKAFGKMPKGFVFIAVEKTPPYALGVYIMPEAGRQLGRETYIKDLEVYQNCRATGNWYGYGQGEAISLELPKWAFSQDKLSDI